MGSMDQEMSVGERIERARKRAGWEKASDFAKHIGRDKATVRRWERGKTRASAEDIHAVAAETGVTPEWLMTGREPTQADPSLVVERFLRSPDGKRAHDIPGAVDFLRHRIDVRGIPVDEGFYRLALIAWEWLSNPDEAARAAEFSRRKPVPPQSE